MSAAQELSQVRVKEATELAPSSVRQQDTPPWPRTVGRYLVYEAFASGGMATVHFGRLLGGAGFARTVAIKRMHRELACDEKLVRRFLDEAWFASHVCHPNVVATRDVVTEGAELLLVLDYVHGESLSALARAARREGSRIPPAIASAIAIQTLTGLDAIHNAKTVSGEALGLVHRDVSPHNVLVGADGVARVADLGVAKAAFRATATLEDGLPGKLGYMAPERLADGSADRRSDVYAVGVVLWEALTGLRLFPPTRSLAALDRIQSAEIEPPSRIVPRLSPDVDEVVMHALARDPNQRFDTARAMAVALQQALPPASLLELGDWVQQMAQDSLAERAEVMARMERHSAPEIMSVVPAEFLLAPDSLPPTRRERSVTSWSTTVTHVIELTEGDVELIDDGEPALPELPSAAATRVTLMPPTMRSTVLHVPAGQARKSAAIDDARSDEPAARIRKRARRVEKRRALVRRWSRLLAAAIVSFSLVVIAMVWLGSPSPMAERPDHQGQSNAPMAAPTAPTVTPQPASVAIRPST